MVLAMPSIRFPRKVIVVHIVQANCSSRQDTPLGSTKHPLGDGRAHLCHLHVGKEGRNRAFR